MVDQRGRNGHVHGYLDANVSLNCGISVARHAIVDEDDSLLFSTGSPPGFLLSQ